MRDRVIVNSINTNASAYLGIRTLNKGSNALNTTQNHISTGKKVDSAKANAAIFSIAQKLLGEMGGLNAAKTSIDRATSTADVAIAASEAISEQLLNLKEKAVMASDPGLDDASRAALNVEFTSILGSIDTFVSSASFSGTNVLQGDSLTAITSSDGSQTLSTPGQDLSLGGAVITVGASDDISTLGNAQATLGKIESALSNMGNTLSALGSTANALERQSEFTTKLNDAIEIGVGNMVDADMGKESANLVADQVKQQLGLQVLSITNKAPSSILSLFS